MVKIYLKVLITRVSNKFIKLGINSMKSKDEVRLRILEEYDEKMESLSTLSIQVENLLKRLLKDINISSMTTRVKARDSLSKKIDIKQKIMGNKPKVYKYETLNDITDICGIRICTFYSDDVDEIAGVIEKEFNIDTENSIDKRATMEVDRFGYLSLHYIVSLSEERTNLTEYNEFQNIKFEIQIRSMLQHTWAEIEHDLGYKSSVGLPNHIKRDFSRVASLLEIADKEFLNIKNSLEEYRMDVGENIQETLNERNIEINRISLIEFTRSKFFRSKVDYIIENTSVISINSKVGDNFIDEIVKSFKDFNIYTIEDLKDIFENSIPFSVNYLKLKEFNKGGINIVAPLLYSLYYIVVSRSLGVEGLQSLFYDLNIGTELGEDETYNIFCEAYNSL